MARTLIAPCKYIQGPGELWNIGTYAAKYGENALILISEGGIKRFGEIIKKSFADAKKKMAFFEFGGECSKKEIMRVIDAVFEEECDCIIGVGGGKIFDTAKAAADSTYVPLIIAPTIAATDAPCSALSVIYTEDGRVESFRNVRQNPDLVLMDSEVIAASPVRLTVSGMGDALATYFEARACKRSDSENYANGKSLNAGQALARLCYDILMEDGYKAKVALEAGGSLTQSVENIIEANTLLSGIGFESCGCAAAHAICDGLSELHETHEYYHGEKVAFGVIAQLVLENAPKEELDEVLDFCISVGLPVTLTQIGLWDMSNDKLMTVAETACAEDDSCHNMPFEVTPKKVADAILAADHFGRLALKARA
ncbi:MAG: glycerol dehydrogenase [Firmicutes bacterium]|nr:glycerol dehydrogenase [Bacillota bacterium]